MVPNNRSYIKLKVNKYKEQPCADCNMQYPWFVMQFDHVRGEKQGNISDMLRRYSWDRVQKEIAKCDVVCANCHSTRSYMRKTMLVDLQDNEIKVGSKVVWNGSSGLHIGVVQNITQKSVAVQRITPPIKYNWETGRVNVPVTLANRRLLVLDVSGTLADDGG